MRVRCVFDAPSLRATCESEQSIPPRQGSHTSGAVPVTVTRNPPPWIHYHDALMLAHVVPVCSISQLAHVGMQAPLVQWAPPAYEEVGQPKQRC